MAATKQVPVEPQISVGVVDDDAIVRSWVRLALEGTEFRVAGEAKTMAEARVLVERGRLELLLVDYRLPDGRGTELVRALRRTGITTSVLVITAAPQPGLNEEVREAGAQGVVLKRAEPEDLRRALREVASGGSVVEAAHPRKHVHGRAARRRCATVGLVAPNSPPPPGDTELPHGTPRTTGRGSEALSLDTAAAAHRQRSGLGG